MEKGLLTLVVCGLVSCVSPLRSADHVIASSTESTEGEVFVAERAERMDTRQVNPLADDRAELFLFMPVTYRTQIHGEAMRLDIADSAILAGAWLGARSSFAASSASPNLASGPSERVYFYISNQIQDEVAVVAEANDRSQSWVFLKAWEMTRSEIGTIENGEAFHAWVRRNRERTRAKS